MAIMKDMDGMSKNLEKVLTQLTQIDKKMDSISSKSGKTSKALSGLGTGNSIMPGGASFGGGSGSGGGEDTTSNGMPIPKFGGSKAAGALSFGLGVAKFGWNATPGLQDTYAQTNALFQTSFFSGNGTNMDSTYGKVRAAFGNTATSRIDQLGASSLLTANGINPESRFFNRTAGEAGFMSKMTGMSNVASASGMLGLQSGAGVSGKLAQYGIFTNNLSNGNFGGMGAVIDQLWARWYGSKSAKVPRAKFDADLLGGFLGRDLRVLFGDQPELYNMIVKGLTIKAQAGGMAGIDFSETAKGPRSGNALAKQQGMDPVKNPMMSQMAMNSAQMDTVRAASEPMMKAFEDATGVIVKFNEVMQGFINSPAGQAMMYGKGFMQTLSSTSEGAAGMGALGGLLGGIGGSLLGRGVGGALGGGGGALGATSMLGAAGRLGGAGLAAIGGNYLTDRLRDFGYNHMGITQGSLWDRIGSVAAMAGTGAGTGALVGGPVGAVLGAVGGGVMGWIKSNDPSSSQYGAGAGAGGDIRTTAGAVSWATNTAGVDGKRWRSICDRFVANAYGLTHSGYQTARDHWQAIPARYKHPGDVNAPAGALVFWNNGNAGHVAIATGSGSVQTTHLNNGTPTTVGLQEVTRQLGGAGIYLGWAEPYFGGRVLSKTGGPSSDGTTSPQETANGDKATESAMAAIGVSPMSAYEMANPLTSRMGSTTTTVFGTSYSSIPGASKADGTQMGSGDPSMRSGPSGRIPTLDTSVSRREFARSVLEGIGAPINKTTKAAMLEWMKHEGGHWANNARYNPLNTTLAMPGSGPMSKNNPNIKAYADWQSGLEATVNTLTSSNSAYGYGKVIDAFRAGNSTGDIYSAIKDSSWGTKTLPSHAHGTDYVSRGGLANVHQGEMIIPASQAMDFREALRDAFSGRGSAANVTVNLQIDKATDEEAERFANKVLQLIKNDQRMDRLRTR